MSRWVLAWLAWGVAQPLSDSLAQVRQLQREVQQLCRFAGRGHGDTGAKQALRYLQRRFRQLGYAPQIDTFWVQVHRIRRIRVQVREAEDGWNAWRVGVDYLPAADAPSLSGEWPVDTLPRQGCAWWVSPETPLREALKHAQKAGVTLLLLPKERLMGSTAQTAAPLPILYVQANRARPTALRLHLKAQTLSTPAFNLSALRTGSRADSAWVVGAHYDHLGRMGSLTFWGANDNASGIAMLLALAAQLRKEEPPYSVWFVAFGAEELGLMGSQAWVQAPRYPLRQLRGMINLDLMGFGEKGVAVVGAADQPAFWKRLDSVRVALGWDPPLLLRPNAPNSDHFPFTQRGVPAVFFYLQGGPGYYHDGYDRPETLTWAAAVPFLRWVRAVLYSP